MTPDTRFPRVPADAVEMLLASVEGNAVAMINCARTLLPGDEHIARAREVCRRALALPSADAEARALARPILSEGVGSWYFTMVLDRPRHALYEQALRRVLASPDAGERVVLDIGAGTGLFAMLAVQAGASHVIACERDPEVARVATQIIARNEMADRITVLPIDSRDLALGDALPHRADVLLWDNLANNFLGAGCAATLSDAKARLVRPGAPVVPARAELLAAPVTDIERGEHAMGMVDGFDLSAFNALRSTDFTLGPDKFALRSQASVLFDFDVTGPEPIRAGRASAEMALSAGRVDGIVQWLRFHIAPGLTYETLGADVRAFGPQFHVLEPFTASQGDHARLHGAHDTLDTWFWMER